MKNSTKELHEAKYAGTCLGDVEPEGFRPSMAGNALLLEKSAKELTQMAQVYLREGLPTNLKEINLTFNRLQSCLKSLRNQLEAVSNRKGADNGR